MFSDPKEAAYNGKTANIQPAKQIKTKGPGENLKANIPGIAERTTDQIPAMLDRFVVVPLAVLPIIGLPATSSPEHP
jgi:hypothetical protein